MRKYFVFMTGAGFFQAGYSDKGEGYYDEIVPVGHKFIHEEAALKEAKVLKAEYERLLETHKAARLYGRKYV